MLLCTQCSDSRWKVSHKSDGVHLVCHAVRKARYKGEHFYGLCGHTMILPHYTSVVATG